MFCQIALSNCTFANFTFYFNLTICLPVIFSVVFMFFIIFFKIFKSFLSMSLMLLFFFVQASHTIFPIFIKQISILCSITPLQYLFSIYYILVIPLSIYIPKWCMKWGRQPHRKITSINLS